MPPARGARHRGARRPRLRERGGPDARGPPARRERRRRVDPRGSCARGRDHGRERRIHRARRVVGRLAGRRERTTRASSSPAPSLVAGIGAVTGHVFDTHNEEDDWDELRLVARSARRAARRPASSASPRGGALVFHGDGSMEPSASRPSCSRPGGRARGGRPPARPGRRRGSSRRCTPPPVAPGARSRPDPRR